MTTTAPDFDHLHLEHVPCTVCDGPVLVTETARPDHCSSACASWAAARPGVKRPRLPCDGCGELFPDDGRGRAWCSARCRQRTERREAAERRIAHEVLATVPVWFDRAACAGVDPALFFPELGSNGTEARRLCAGCPVADECLTYALELDQVLQGRSDGIFGGLTGPERDAYRRNRTPAAA